MIRLLVSFILALVCAPSVVLAQQEVPKLIGVWTGEKTMYYLEGARQSISVLTINEQDGPYFSGTFGWRHPEDKKAIGNIDGVATTEAIEPILGMIGFDNETLTIVDHGDLGRFSGKLIDSNTMQLVYSEVGDHAAVHRAVLTRRAE